MISKKIMLLTVCVLLIVACVFSFPTNPPQPLHQVGDHWTPYNPPLEFPEGTNVYTIQAGDTLWSLAEEFLEDPFLWPQLWENNTYITDAHWIYPGDPLVIQPVQIEEVSPEDFMEQPGDMQAGMEGEEAEDMSIHEYKQAKEMKPVPLGTTYDMYCFAKVTPIDMDYPLTIKGTDDATTRYTFTDGQIVYLSGGSAEGVQAGDEFLIADDKGILKNDEGTELGKLWFLQGKLAVLCTREHTSTARITMACDSIIRGFHLIPFEVVPIPTAVPGDLNSVCQSSSGKVQGKIISTKDELISIAQGHTALVGLGKADGIEPGQLLTVYRNQEEEGNPYTVLGRLGVLQVFDHTSSCKVLHSVLEMEIGDLVELY